MSFQPPLFHFPQAKSTPFVDALRVRNESKQNGNQGGSFGEAQTIAASNLMILPANGIGMVIIFVSFAPLFAGWDLALFNSIFHQISPPFLNDEGQFSSRLLLALEALWAHSTFTSSRSLYKPLIIPCVASRSNSVRKESERCSDSGREC